jgi:hypothetical protein
MGQLGAAGGFAQGFRDLSRPRELFAPEVLLAILEEGGAEAEEGVAVSGVEPQGLLEVKELLDAVSRRALAGRLLEVVGRGFVRPA